MTLEELEKRVQVLEDIEAIKKLKMRYSRANDHKNHVNHPEEYNEIFTEDGVWDGKQFGLYKGRKEIIAALTRLAPRFVFSLHYFTNPDITVEGDKAYGRWCVWMPATMTVGNTKRGVLLAGYEDDEYVKINGRWWQTRMTLDVGFLTDIEEGWHSKTIIEV